MSAGDHTVPGAVSATFDFDAAKCSDPPAECCADVACPVHGWPDVDDELADEGDDDD